MPDPTQTMRVQQPAFESLPLLVDCEGDVWRPVGRTAAGDVLLVCDAPQDPEERGNGEPFPWTQRAVTGWFGPLTSVVEVCHDAEMRAGHPHLAHETDSCDEAFALLAPGRPVQVSA